MTHFAMYNQFVNLDHLKLSNNKIDVKAAAALASGDTLKRLTILDVRGCDLHDDGLEKLLRAHFVCNIKTLILDENHLTEEGAVSLGRSALFELQSLSLAWN